MTIRFPYSRQEITAEDEAAVLAVLRSPYLTQGPAVPAFEAAFCDATGAAHTVAVANGTAALHLAYLACALGPERGLVTSPITFLATGNAARMLGAPVAFADVDPATGLMTPETLDTALGEARFPVGAVAVVHLGGRVADLPGLRAVTDRYGCRLVEDACHAPGAVYAADGRRHPVGACAHSDIATFSFHPVKHVAMGEGGAVTVAEGALADRLRRLRSHAIDRDPRHWRHPPEAEAPWYYEMAELGWNYRLTDLASALGRSQLGRLASGIARRRALVARYGRALANRRHLSPPPDPQPAESHAWHLYAPAVDFAGLGRTRGEVMRALRARGVGTQVHYIPLTEQPYYRALGAATPPGAARYYARTLSLPLYPAMTDADQDEVVAAVDEVMAP